MPSPLKPNTQPGTCGRCGEIVRVGEGRAARARGFWKAFHIQCGLRNQGLSHAEIAKRMKKPETKL